jgi:large subunit ribosomal protein L15
LPLVKRLPFKRGFVNRFRVEYAIVKVGDLERFQPQSEVTPALLAETGLVKSAKKPVKVLGDGELDKSLLVRAHKFSAKAKEKIEAAGGRAEVIA